MNFSLAQVQGWLQQQVLLQSSVAPLADVQSVVNPSARLSAQAHLDIYKGSYIARLRECMRAQFGALAYALGTELFEAFADHYLACYPSHSYTLNDLGLHFADYLQQTRPDADSEVKEDWPDFMIELAQFEYNLSLIFDEYATEDIDLAEETCPDQMLRLNPVCHPFAHSYPVCDYYLAYSRKENPELPLPEPSYCVVTRLNYKMGLFVIKPAQYYFLQLGKQGQALEAALVQTARHIGTTDLEMHQLWQAWRNFFRTTGIIGQQPSLNNNK